MCTVAIAALSTAIRENMCLIALPVRGMFFKACGLRFKVA